MKGTKYNLYSRFKTGEKLFPLYLKEKKGLMAEWCLAEPFSVRAIEFFLPNNTDEHYLFYRPYNRDCFVSDTNAFVTKEEAKAECDMRNEEIREIRCEYYKYIDIIAKKYNFIESMVGKNETI